MPRWPSIQNMVKYKTLWETYANSFSLEINWEIMSYLDMLMKLFLIIFCTFCRELKSQVSTTLVVPWKFIRQTIVLKSTKKSCVSETSGTFSCSTELHFTVVRLDHLEGVVALFVLALSNHWPSFIQMISTSPESETTAFKCHFLQ